ncbi:geranylgeranyl reductase family protein [Nanchangia anserum]|uniref:Geranylgeranyl reductase family protein n=1 Tax=Nanchangia anserum TaxID=2692125 RepID=A0A8I0GC80_9ACTO|nr:geranylgeranyl reductase family protein [Nanchangia anserum]MBD3689336.1 geranylgeranyl reductase family protein [Nanchangia anserum]QOX81544.1 geranylgeranyl reductase family protein [Nanchangia anserum]
MTVGSEIGDPQVVVVGAGPGGAATAYHLATAGIDVVVFDKATFPRDKVCGDGLTPAAVAEILAMGIDPNAEEGWQKNRGLTVIGGGHRIQLPWPESSTLPGYGMARARMDLDHRLLTQAKRAGARVFEGMTVTEPLRGRDGAVVGVRVVPTGERDRDPIDVKARYVVDAGGASARLATAVGLAKNPARPMAVAARAYFTSPRGDEEWMESHLELWDGPRGESNLLPGYGWIFPLGEGTVNVGLGSVSSSARATKLPYRQIFTRWVATLPEEWQLTPVHQRGDLRSAPLPMCHNRTPHYRAGLLLVGDAGGMISPFNGEGIAPAMQAGRLGAQTIVQALGRTSRAGAEAAMSAYPRAIRDANGGYYSLGRLFVRLIENPEIMRICTTYGLPRPTLMRFVHKLLSDGFERRGGDGFDRILQALTAMAPKV